MVGAARRRSVRLGAARARSGTTYADPAAATSTRLLTLIFKVLAGIECSFLMCAVNLYINLDFFCTSAASAGAPAEFFGQ